MDRSYWSNPEVIAAARDFVCIRLVTYENEEEGAFVQSIFRGREGTLENSIFALLAPDGKTLLANAGRSPSMVFDGVNEDLDRALLLKKMADIIKRYPARKVQAQPLALGLDLRRMMNVAACDLQPLVVLYAAHEKDRSGLAALVAKESLKEAYRGRFAFAWAQSALEIKALTGLEVETETSMLWVMAPNEFGTQADLLQSVSQPKAKTLTLAWAASLKEFSIEARNSRRHTQKGRQLGVKWVSQLPNTDPKSNRIR